MPDQSPLAARRSRYAHAAIQLGIALVGVGPLYALSIYTGLASLAAKKFVVPGSIEMLANVGMMLFFGLLIIALLLMVGERPRDLQLRPGTVPRDIWQGLLLLLAILGGLGLLSAVLRMLDFSAIPDANLEIGKALAHDPLLFLVFIGPVVWLQAGVLEELTRVFVLSRMWKVWTSPLGKMLSLVAWSTIFGLAHIYQGASGVIGTAVIGFVLGAHYLIHGRVLPLVIAHALYDTLALSMLVYMAQHPELLPK